MLCIERLGPAILISLVIPLANASSIEAGESRYCLIQGAEYYTIELVTTKNIPGTGLATGRADLSTPVSSPFSLGISQDGSYEYSVHVSLERMKIPTSGQLVAWVTTRELDEIERLGPLDEKFRVSGKVGWNKFLVVITLEADNNPEQSMWAGPIVFRGVSRSGMMHTMVGHGALQQENCAAYGYAS